MAVTLHVCITCRAGEAVPEGAPCAGARLYAAIARETGREVDVTPDPDAPVTLPAPVTLAEGVTLRPVVCLAACQKGCTLSLAGPGRWSYIYGELTEGDAPAILAGLTAYAASADGIVPWRERPEIFRKRTLARIPPSGDPA